MLTLIPPIDSGTVTMGGNDLVQEPLRIPEVIGPQGDGIERLKCRIPPRRKSSPEVASLEAFTTMSDLNSTADLPVAAEKRNILDKLETNPILICIGETGSGKTTQIPQYILEHLQTTTATPDHIWLQQLQSSSFYNYNSPCICITQPRRVAAVSVATRVAKEQHCRCGAEVGYVIRFDDNTSARTKLKYVTDGVLVREVMTDPMLRRYAAVILDEAHERSVHTDVLFGILKDLVKRRHDLRVLIMSATLDTRKFSTYFNDAPVISIPGRSFPVQVYHSKRNVSSISLRYVEKAVDTLLRIHTVEPWGDVLCFLTGQDEIERACEMLREKWRQWQREGAAREDMLELCVIPMYGALPRHQQELAFAPSRKDRRKVIIATNIAETSLTVDGIRFVVDPGFVKQKHYLASKGIDQLSVVPISQSSAQQRAGRAGRTADGKCYRLFKHEAFLHRPKETTPEIQRTSLTQVVLQLKVLHIENILDFDFIDPPSRDALGSALKDLFWIDAISKHGKLTSTGKRLATFPLEPSLARFLLEASKFGCLEDALTVAAMLSVEKVFYRGSRRAQEQEVSRVQQKFYHRYGDHFTYLRVYHRFKEASGSQETWCKQHYIHYHSLKRADSIRRQLVQYAKQSRLEFKEDVHHSNNELRRALCLGFYPRAAHAIGRKGYKAVSY